MAIIIEGKFNVCPEEKPAPSVTLGNLLGIGSYLAARVAVIVGVPGGIAYDGLKHGIDLIRHAPPHHPLQLAGGVLLTAIGSEAARRTIFKYIPHLSDELTTFRHAREGKVTSKWEAWDDVFVVRGNRIIDHHARKAGQMRHFLNVHAPSNLSGNRFG